MLGPLLETSPREVWVANRTAEKATALAQRHAALAHQLGVTLHACGLEALRDDPDARFALVINASASSLAGSASSSRTSLKGAVHVVDGLGMLVEQAAAAFEWWRGVRPQTGPVLSALRARLAATAASPPVVETRP